jgi:hypothetical protein
MPKKPTVPRKDGRKLSANGRATTAKGRNGVRKPSPQKPSPPAKKKSAIMPASQARKPPAPRRLPTTVTEQRKLIRRRRKAMLKDFPAIIPFNCRASRVRHGTHYRDHIDSRDLQLKWLASKCVEMEDLAHLARAEIKLLHTQIMDLKKRKR